MQRPKVSNSVKGRAEPLEVENQEEAKKKRERDKNTKLGLVSGKHQIWIPASCKPYFPPPTKKLQ